MCPTDSMPNLGILFEVKMVRVLRTRGLLGLIGIACKHAFDALEKVNISLCKNGLWYFELVKDG